MANNISEILSRLVIFRTETGNSAGIEKCLDYCESCLDEQLLTVRITNNDFMSLVATSKPNKRPKVLLQAHMDVVPGKNALFKLKDRDGKLFGRGVFDMKFAAACYLQLVEDLKDDLADYDFGIMLTSDEEVGGENGVNYLLNAGYGADVCVLPDGGDNWQIETGCNGGWMVRVIANGQSAHGSRPWEGDNAILNLTGALHEIRAIFGSQEPYKSSVTVSQIEGGTAINQVPDRAMATLDMRFFDRESYVAKRKRVESIAKSMGMRLETIAHADVGETDVTDPAIHSFIKIAERIRGEPLEKTHSLGSSDARFFFQHDIPTIVIRPTGGGTHSDREWIDKAGLFQYYEVLKAYVKEVAKIK